MRWTLFLISICTLLCAMGRAQDSPPLGDVARQARQQKQKDAAAAKDAPTQDAAVKQPSTDAAGGTSAKPATAPKGPKKIITNDEIPSHLAPPHASNPGVETPAQADEGESDGGGKPSADYWRSRIQSMKQNIAAMEDQLKSLADSIHYAGGNCVANCAQWNERQKQKQDQVDVMTAQVEQQRKQLEDMQEACRKQGYGSSVYDP